jgi:hypothetical protein
MGAMMLKDGVEATMMNHAMKRKNAPPIPHRIDQKRKVIPWDGGFVFVSACSFIFSSFHHRNHSKIYKSMLEHVGNNSKKSSQSLFRLEAY